MAELGLIVIGLWVLGIYLLLRAGSPPQKTPEEQKEERLETQKLIREAAASAKSCDVPLTDVMREWFPELGEEHWEAVLNPVWYTTEAAEETRESVLETVPDSGPDPDLALYLDGLDKPEPHEYWLRRQHEWVLERRLECEHFPGKKSARKRLKEAEGWMERVVLSLLHHYRESIWRDLMAAIDGELGDPSPAYELLRSIAHSYEYHETDNSFTPLPLSAEVTREFGDVTEEDRDFVSDHFVSSFSTYDADQELKAKGVDLLTKEGRLLARQLYRQYRAKQEELVDLFRNRRVRERLATKRAQLGGVPSQPEEETAEAATVRGERFERHVADVLSAEWPEFECQHLGKHKQTERGIDLLFLGANGERIGVQCKQHAQAREPSYQEWQSFLGGCTFHKIPEGSRVFVTTGTLSIRQRQEAKKLGVVVFYKDELAHMAEEHGIEPWS